MSARLSAKFSGVAVVAASLLGSPAAFAQTAVSPPPFNFMNPEAPGPEPTAGGGGPAVERSGMRAHGHHHHHHHYHSMSP